MANKKKTTRKKGASRKASAKSPPAAKAAFGSKSDFIRSQSSDVPAKEIVARALAKGITLTEGLVYNVRSGKTSSGAASRGPRASTNQPQPIVVESSLLERQLRTVVLRLGLDRSKQLFAEYEGVLSTVEQQSAAPTRRRYNTNGGRQRLSSDSSPGAAVSPVPGPSNEAPAGNSAHAS